MAPVIKSTQGFGVANGIKILVYAKAGMGKTTLCGTCPSPIILSAEGGLLSLARMNLPYIEIKSLPDLRDAYLWLRSSPEAKKNFQTICTDSISEIAEVCLASQKAKVKDGRMAYGEMIDEMVKVVREIRDLPGYHSYMTCKQERIVNAEGGILNGPSMPGNKLGQAMPYFPDEVFKLDFENFGGVMHRVLRTQPTFSDDAKDRSGVLDAIEQPHIGNIINKILGAFTSAPQ